MRNQKRVLKEVDWDFLIILDACRYDYFEEIYGDYLSGRLNKIRSPASQTGDWIKAVMPLVRRNLKYFSSCPGINSYGIGHAKFLFEDMRPWNHFDIIDVWDSGWDPENNTVPPKEVNKSVLKDNPEKAIIHYNQPHAPYLTFEHNYVKDETGDVVKNAKMYGGKNYSFKEIRVQLGSLARKILPPETIWRTKKFLGLPPITPIAEVVRREGIKGLRKRYRENLELVLSSVSKLLEELSGKIVVTSDHGELLGESHLFAHDEPKNHPKLRKVPWLEVEI